MARDGDAATPFLTAQDLLAGSRAVHEVEIPADVLAPGGGNGRSAVEGKVQLRPLSLAALAVISRAARDDSGQIPVLMIREALVEPRLEVAQVRQMHAGLVDFLMRHIGAVSGLDLDGDRLAGLAGAPLTESQVLLARHFGWTPQQVAELTPAQVAIYLAGLERLRQIEGGEEAQ